MEVHIEGWCTYDWRQGVSYPSSGLEQVFLANNNLDMSSIEHRVNLSGRDTAALNARASISLMLRVSPATAVYVDDWRARCMLRIKVLDRPAISRN